MKKFKLKRTGKEVKTGDTVIFFEDVLPEGVEEITGEADVTEVTEETLKDLIKAGIIEESNDELCIEGIINHLAGRMKLDFEEVDATLGIMDSMCEYAVFSLLLKEAAIMLDSKYSGHISKSREIYTVNTQNGDIMEIPKENILTYRSIAAFRSKEDAKEAIKALLPVWVTLYGRKQKS